MVVFSIQKNKEWSIIHKCSRCKTIRINRIASDDNELLLLTLAAETLMSLPFPSKKIISTLHRLSIKKGNRVFNERLHNMIMLV